MDVFSNINALMLQLGTSCAFDSPGLARNEPTSGNQNKLHLPTLTFKEELQYTDYTLCFYEKICIFAPNNSSRYEQRVGKDAECDHKTGLNQYEK